MVEAMNNPETDDAVPRRGGRGNNRGGGRARGAKAAPAITTDRLISLIEGLGLVDMLTNQIRTRLENVDLDDVFRDIGWYMRRYPEVLVVALATITVSSALIVYLNSRTDDDDFDYDDDDDDVNVVKRAAAPVRATASRLRGGPARSRR